MSTRFRSAVWIAGAGLLLLLVIAWILPSLVDINRYHGLIESKVEDFFHRDVQLGPLRVVLLPLPGFSVESVSLASDRSQDPPLLKAASITARARLFPLLRGQIEIASIQIEKPELNLRRNRTGGWNLPTFSSTSGGAARDSAATKTTNESGIIFGKVRIHEAKLRLLDEGLFPDKKLTTTLEGVDVWLENEGPQSPFRLRLETKLPPGRSGALHLSGTLTPANRASGAREIKLALSLEQFQPSAFAPYFQALAGLDPPRGRISTDLKGQATLLSTRDGGSRMPEDGRLTGSIVLSDFSLGASSGARSSLGDLALQIEMAIGKGGKRLEFKTLEIESGKSRLHAAGELRLGKAETDIELRVAPSKIRMADLAPVAAVLGAEFPAGLTSAKPITFSGRLRGPLEDPTRLRYEGEIALAGVRYAGPTLGQAVEDVAGLLSFQNDAMQIRKFEARVARTKLTGQLTIRQFTAPLIELELNSEEAILDELLGLLQPSGTSRTAGTASSSDGKKILARTRGTGTIRIQKGTFGTFRFTDFEGRLRMAGAEVTFDPVSFQLYGGTYQGSLTTDLGGKAPRYRYRSQLREVQSQPFLAENLNLQELMAGRVSADLELEGTGESLETLLRTLKGKGTMKVESGWIGELNVLKGLAQASDLLGEKTLAETSRAVAKSRTDFSELSGDLVVADGRVTTRNLFAVTENLTLKGKGSFTLGGELDLDLDVLFSQKLTQSMLAEGSRARYLGREDGRIVLPLTIQGPLTSPRYGVDLSSITRAAARSELTDKLSRSKSPLSQLAGKLLAGQGKEGPPPSTPPGKSLDESTPAPEAVDRSASGITVTSGKYGGNFLVPDLTLRGSFTGTHLASADLKILGENGEVVLEKTDAFGEIAAYQTTQDVSRPANIPFTKKIDGKRLIRAGDLEIIITLHHSDGTRTVETFKQPKRGL